jgi:uncharacterized protein (UPF0332 family)
MFYAAPALLEGEVLSFSKHSAVIAAFGKQFARTGRAGAQFHAWLRQTKELRYFGDYGPFDAITGEMAGEQLSRAASFVEMAERLLTQPRHV